jgi:hypothetical protein
MFSFWLNVIPIFSSPRGIKESCLLPREPMGIEESCLLSREPRGIEESCLLPRGYRRMIYFLLGSIFGQYKI